MSYQRLDNIAAASLPIECEDTRSQHTPTYEIEKLWAQKYGNYCVFVQSIAEYLPEARTWAQGLQYMPLMAFKLRLAGYFTEAVGHAREKNTVERDKAVALVIRSNAKLHGFNVEKVRPDYYIKLLR